MSLTPGTVLIVMGLTVLFFEVVFQILVDVVEKASWLCRNPVTVCSSRLCYHESL